MDPKLAPCMDCLCLASRRAARAITRRFERELRPHGLRATQFSLLVTLTLAGPCQVGELAERLGVERTTLTRNLAPLRANGLVQIRAADTDARARVLAITDQGRTAIGRALPAWERAQTATSAAIGEPAAAALRRLAEAATA